MFHYCRWDGDFRTLRHLVDKNAFGTIVEAEIHYDFENLPWIKYLSAKEYKPGDGVMFGLGRYTSHPVCSALTYMLRFTHL